MCLVKVTLFFFLLFFLRLEVQWEYICISPWEGGEVEEKLPLGELGEKNKK